jgi:hypothetical protein
MMCWHKWGKWELYEVDIYDYDFKDKEGNYIRGKRRKQRRQCIKCGKYQEGWV